MISDVEQSLLSSASSSPSPVSVLRKDVGENGGFPLATCKVETSDGGKALVDTQSSKPSSTAVSSVGGGEAVAKEKENTNAGVIDEEGGGKEGEKGGEEAASVSQVFPVLRRSGRLSNCRKDSVAISELAKKVQLRVKRVRRAAKPNLSVKQSTPSQVKEAKAKAKANAVQKGENFSDLREVKGSTSLVDALSEVQEMKDKTGLMDAVSEAKRMEEKTGILDAVPEVTEVRVQPSSLDRQDDISKVEEITMNRRFQVGRQSEVSDAVDIKAKTHNFDGRHIVSEVKEVKDAESHCAHDASAAHELHYEDPLNGGRESLCKVEFQTIEKASMPIEDFPFELEDISNSDQVEGNKHISDAALEAENKTQISEDNEYSSRDWCQREHDHVMHDYSINKRNPSRCGSPRECSSLHGRFEGRNSDMPRSNLREKPVLEAALPDEPPGFNLNGRNTDRVRDRCIVGPSHMIATEPTTVTFDSKVRDYVSAHSVSVLNNKEEYVDSKGIQDQRVGCKSGNAANHSSISSLSKRSCFQDQAQSMACDIAQGDTWKICKRSGQAEDSEGKQLRSYSDVPDNRLVGVPHFPYDDQCIGFVEQGFAYDNQYYGAPEYGTDCFNHYDELQGYALNYSSQHNKPQKYALGSGDAGCALFSHLIQLNWRSSSDAVPEKSNNINNNNIKIVKERSIFVGCIPDGIENLDLLLQTMMEQFLERFDFAPVRVGQVQLIKTVKDFAFIELATEKVAQLVLSANQLDVFEWGINGYHFNIQGCTATYTSVRPLIEYMPLKPARVVFVANIPKFRWQEEFLDSYFTTLLRGSDGPTDWKYVSRVYLLPESSDAYVEMTSELLADALMFKCGKLPGFLREIGPDVFICRDRRSIPLMSRHKGTICPQRSLYIGITPPGVEFKIDYVMKTISELLPFIARNSNQRGYLEYVNFQPGKDYAFFQFNTEAFVDAIMDEYIENTHIFVCRESKVPYIILRPPGYMRPQERYVSDIPNSQSFIADQSDTEKSNRTRSISSDPDNNIGLKLRRFGDEPVKKPDCIISIGASPLPSAIWNESSSGLRSNNPDCMIVIEGLSIKHNYRLIRGALNELFERSLWHTGLVEAGMLVVRYLEQDGNLAVATLMNADLVSALLSMRRVFVLAGQEIRLLPENCRRNFHWKGHSADLSGDHELSYFSDEDSQGRPMIQRSSVEYNPDCMMQNDRGYTEANYKYPPQYSVSGERNMDDQNPPEYDSISKRNRGDVMYPQSGSRQRETGSRNGYGELPQWHSIKAQQHNFNAQVRSVEPVLTCEGNNPRARVLHGQRASGFANNNGLHREGGSRILRKNCPDEGFQTLSKEGKRTIYNPVCESERFVDISRKRKMSEFSPENVKRFSSRRMHHHPSMVP